MDDEDEELETDHLEDWSIDPPTLSIEPIGHLPVVAQSNDIRSRMYRVCCSAHQDACTCS